jgi:hypothetical protein
VYKTKAPNAQRRTFVATNVVTHAVSQWGASWIVVGVKIQDGNLQSVSHDSVWVDEQKAIARAQALGTLTQGD